ncbi:MAG: T9SS type A sorting domain-containing protein [Bacteroidetes bacterium]|nr:T9SS type A sorting domain-containing protein [Bacteroidota bacterium]
MKKILLLLSASLLCLTQVDAQISVARTAPLNSTVTITGRVLNGSELGSIRYIGDSTAAMAAYGSNLSSVLRGDSITVTGTLTEYYGLFEIQPVTSFTVHSNVGTPTALIISPSQISEAYEGELVQFDNASFSAGGGTFAGNSNYTVTSNSQSFTVRVGNGSPLVGTLIPTGIISLRGIMSQFCPPIGSSGCTTGYQLLPRDLNDIIAANGISVTTQLMASNLSTSGFQIDWSSNITPTASFIKYGLTKSLELGVWQGSFNGTANTTIVTGLTAGTIYYAQAFSVNGNDTAYSGIRVFGTVSNSSGDIKAYFNRSVDTLQANSPTNHATTLVNLTDDTLIAYFNRAKYTIDFTIYNFDNNNISNISAALNAAYNRGVKIRGIYDGAAGNPGMNNLNAAIGKIASPTSSTYGIMHNKFVIIDANSSNANDCILWTGSANWTDNQINTDNQNVIIFQDQTLCRSYELEFEEMFGDTGLVPNASAAKFGPDKTDNTAHEFLIGGKRVEQYFSPTDGVNSQIIRAINTADSDLEVEIMVMTRNDLAYAISNKSQAGVNCYYLTNDSTSNLTTWPIIRNALGAKAKDYNQGGIMHSKYLIVDATNAAADPLVLTGSHNWSNGADQKNDENTVVVHDVNIANKYYQEFVKRFNLNGGLVLTSGNYIVSDLAMQVYPNPTNGVFELRFKSDATINSMIQLFDITGKEVYVEKIAAKNGTNLLQINASEFSKGMYMLKLTSGNASTLQKIIID